ncbi:hypothetical protein AAV94_06425 [Lampropedia cohaerens]|uniref:Uncharacterized protein n=1 Tax=Lampropedia cohaerens TaxID=1610491 RepID=A0A0U1Q024_9BURK|nr:hypothetical protein AAV94_06425 [Lampropedia cohaerens]
MELRPRAGVLAPPQHAILILQDDLATFPVIIENEEVANDYAIATFENHNKVVTRSLEALDELRADGELNHRSRIKSNIFCRQLSDRTVRLAYYLCH